MFKKIKYEGKQRNGGGSEGVRVKVGYLVQTTVIN